MKKAGFRIVDEPQLYINKSQGFRKNEKAKDVRTYITCTQKLMNIAYKMLEQSRNLGRHDPI